MPSTKGMRLLVSNRSALTPQDWTMLIEARRELIEPHLDKFTLPKLGDLKCLYSERPHYGELRSQARGLSPEMKKILEFQGVFHSQPFTERTFFPPLSESCSDRVRDGILLVWGLMRNGKWVVVEISYRGAPGYKDRGAEIATALCLEEVDITRLISLTKEDPEKIWEILGQTVREWERKRRSLHEQSLALVVAIECEDRAMECVER